MSKCPHVESLNVLKSLQISSSVVQCFLINTTLYSHTMKCCSGTLKGMFQFISSKTPRKIQCWYLIGRDFENSDYFIFFYFTFGMNLSVQSTVSPSLKHKPEKEDKQLKPQPT